MNGDLCSPLLIAPIDVFARRRFDLDDHRQKARLFRFEGEGDASASRHGNLFDLSEYDRFPISPRDADPNRRGRGADHFHRPSGSRTDPDRLFERDPDRTQISISSPVEGDGVDRNLASDQRLHRVPPVSGGGVTIADQSHRTAGAIGNRGRRDDERFPEGGTIRVDALHFIEWESIGVRSPLAIGQRKQNGPLRLQPSLYRSERLHRLADLLATSTQGTIDDEQMVLRPIFIGHRRPRQPDHQ